MSPLQQARALTCCLDLLPVQAMRSLARWPLQCSSFQYAEKIIFRCRWPLGFDGLRWASMGFDGRKIELDTPPNMDSMQCLSHSAHNIAKMRRFCDRHGIVNRSLHNQRVKLEDTINGAFRDALIEKGIYSWVEYIWKFPEEARKIADRAGLGPGLGVLVPMRIIESGYVDLVKNYRQQNRSDPNLIGKIYREYPDGINKDPSDLDMVIVYPPGDAQRLVDHLSDTYITHEGSTSGSRYGFNRGVNYAGIYHA
jgi:hypothetical protein